MRATQYFHRGLLLGKTRIKRKEIQRNTLRYFLEFLVFFNKRIKGKSKNEKNYLHGKAPNKQKKNKEIFWIFFLVLLLSMHGK